MYNTIIPWDFKHKHQDSEGNLELHSEKGYLDYLSSEFKRVPIEDKALTLARLIYFGLDLPNYVKGYKERKSYHTTSTLSDTLLCYIQTLRWGERIHDTTSFMLDNMDDNDLVILLQEELKVRYTIWEGIGEDRLVFSRWRDEMLHDMALLVKNDIAKTPNILVTADFSREYKEEVRVPKEKFNLKNDNMKLTINELLETRGITEKDKVKFIRHKFNNCKESVEFYNPETGQDEKLESFVTIEDFYRNRNEDFQKYQNTQLTSNFKNVNYIVSFIAESGTRARFVGVYKLEGEPIAIADTPDGKPKSYYNFVETDILKDLKERIIIDWGSSTRRFDHWFANKKEILMIGDPLGDLPFPGYMDFTLTRSKLERVFEFEYKEWKNALTAVNCIYLITDNSSGQRYVGSTYNTDGIWGRWKCYFDTIHGNAKLLRKLIKEKGEKHKDNLQYTILQILPLNITAKEAVDRENIYKEKLGTRLDLNAN